MQNLNCSSIHKHKSRIEAQIRLSQHQLLMCKRELATARSLAKEYPECADVFIQELNTHIINKRRLTARLLRLGCTLHTATRWSTQLEGKIA